MLPFYIDSITKAIGIIAQKSAKSKPFGEKYVRLA